MMQTAEARERNDLAERGGFNGAAVRCVGGTRASEGRQGTEEESDHGEHPGKIPG